MTVERDVIIVGAGIAGTICASYLAKAGADVLLLDKEVFPRDKACGDLLREGVVTHLSRLGLFDRIDAGGTLLRRIHVMSENGSECVLPFEGYAMPRFQVDSLLADVAVSRGAEFRDGCRVRELIEEDGWIRGVRARERGEEIELRSRLVILADGAGSLLSGAISQRMDGARSAGGCGAAAADQAAAAAETADRAAGGTEKGPAGAAGAAAAGAAVDGAATGAAGAADTAAGMGPAAARRFAGSGRYIGERAYFARINLEEALAKGQYNAYGAFGFHQKLRNGYFWVVPSGANGVRDGYCNVGILCEAEGAEEISAQEIFGGLFETNTRVAALFLGARQVSPWKRAQINDVTGIRYRCDNGCLIIGDAGSVMLPLLKDGTSAAADCGEAAAIAAKEAIRANDFSAEYLYQEYVKRIEPDKSRLRFERITAESLYDPTVSNPMIGRLVNNPTYRKKVLQDVFG